MKGEGEREHTGKEPGKLPLAEELDQIADEAREATRIKTITEPGQAAMEKTSTKYTRIRDEAIQATIAHVLKKHFGQGFSSRPDRPSGDRQPPGKPEELEAIGYESPADRAGALVSPNVLDRRDGRYQCSDARRSRHEADHGSIRQRTNSQIDARAAKEIAKRLKLDPGRFGTKLNEQERQSINNRHT
jgi:hypothetical protein